MQLNSKIFIAGHTGLVGSALTKVLKQQNYTNLILKKHEDLDLTNQQNTQEFFAQEKPEYVMLAAAKVGGILANNTYRADFIYQNLQIQNNVIHESYKHNVKKLLFLGSSCVYPKKCPQPIKENYLLKEELEYTNEPYAIAKIAGIKMCENYNLQYDTNYISVMPANLYGPHDNFDLATSHVLPAVIRKMHLAKLLNDKQYDKVLTDLKMTNLNKAIKYLKQIGITNKQVEIWGDGSPRREFLYSEELANACIFIMKNIDFKDLIAGDQIKNTQINIGTGSDISIKDLAYLVKNIVGFEGRLFFNKTKPNGTMVKLTDNSKLTKFGWQNKVDLTTGITKLYNYYQQAA